MRAADLSADGTATTPPSWGVTVEVYALRLLDTGGLGYRRIAEVAEPGADLDEVALRLVGVGSCAGAVCHSTSWRREGSAVVVTYAVLPDLEPAVAADVLVRPSIVVGSTALRPTPEVLHGHHVVAHAVRHLADLLGRDPVVAKAASSHPRLWDAVQRTAEATATGTHADAHAQAAALASP